MALSRTVIAIVLAYAPHVFADPIQVHAREDTDETWLSLDPELRPAIEGIATLEHREGVDYDIRGTRIRFESVEWANDDRAGAGAYHLDTPARGWRVAARFSRDVGPLQLELMTSADHVDTPFGVGTSLVVGVQLIRRWRISRWMHAFISLGGGRRQWIGYAPNGEASDTTFMLRIGTTFR